MSKLESNRNGVDLFYIMEDNVVFLITPEMSIPFDITSAKYSLLVYYYFNVKKFMIK